MAGLSSLKDKDLSGYWEQHNVRGLFEEMLTDLLENQPEDVNDHLSRWLSQTGNTQISTEKVKESSTMASVEEKSSSSRRRRVSIAAHGSTPRRIKLYESSLQGSRPTQEDAHVFKEMQDFPGVHLHCIFDGHAGDGASKYAARHIEEYVARKLKGPANQIEKEDIQEAFVELDNALLRDTTEDAGGCTAAVCVFNAFSNVLTTANVGDARAVLSRSGKAVPLTKDHKPSDPEEQKRITAAGHAVIRGRLNMVLAVSRALGDKVLKEMSSEHGPEKALKPWEQPLSPWPYVEQHVLTDADEFLVVACDGLFDVMSNQEVVDWVHGRVQAMRRQLDRRRRAEAAGVDLDDQEDQDDEDDPDDIKPLQPSEMLELLELEDEDDLALDLAGAALAKGSTDNVSVMIIFFGPSTNENDDAAAAASATVAAKATNTKADGLLSGLALRFPDIAKSFQNVKAVFDKAVGQEGVAQVHQLKDIVNQLGGPKLSDDEVQQLFSTADLDNSSTITFRKFLIVVSTGVYLKEDESSDQKSPEDSHFLETKRGFEIVRKAFRRIDADKGGTLDPEELKRALFKTSNSQASKDILEARFKELDFDGDGDIYFPEFVYGIFTWVAHAMDDADEDEEETK